MAKAAGDDDEMKEAADETVTALEELKEEVDTLLKDAKALAKKPFGVNLITMHPALFDLIAVCAKHNVGHVVLAGGLPPKGSLEAIKEGGAKVICFAPTLTRPRVWRFLTTRTKIPCTWAHLSLM